VNRRGAALEVSELLMAADRIPRMDGKMFFYRKSLECMVKTMHYEMHSVFPSEKNEWKFWKIMRNIESELDASVRTTIWSLHNFINKSELIHWTPENSSSIDPTTEYYSTIGDEIRGLFHLAFEFELEREGSKRYSNEMFSETVNRVVRSELTDRNISEESKPEDLSSEDAEDIDEILTVANIAEENGVAFGAWESFDLGNAALVRGSTEAAERSFKESLRLFQEEGDKEGILASYNCMAALALRSGDLDEARHYWRKIHDITDKNEIEVDKAAPPTFSSLNGLGSVSYHRGKFQMAESLFSQALEVAINLDDAFLESIALTNLGATNSRLGMLDLGYDMYLESLGKLKKNMIRLSETYDERDLCLHESEILRGLAFREEAKGNISKAASLHTESMDLQRKFGDRYREAGSLVNLGNLASNNGRYVEAQELMGNALQIMKDVGAQGKVAGILMNLGNIAQHQSEFDNAESFYRQARRASRGIATPSLLDKIHSNLGDIARIRGDLDEAMLLYKKSFDITNSIEGYEGERSRAFALGRMGVIYRLKKNLEEAHKCYTESMQIRKSIGDMKGISASMGSLGLVEQELGNLDEAEKLFSQALIIDRDTGFRKGEGSMLSCLSKLEISRGDYDKAMMLSSEALSIRREIGFLQGQATSLHTLGEINWYLGNWEETEKLYRESLEISRKIGYSLGESELLDDLGRLLLDNGDYHESENLLRKCVRIKIEIGVPLNEWLTDRGFTDPDADWTFPPAS